MFGWTVTDIPLLLALPLLLMGSAFFSGSETAIFGLRPHQLAALQHLNTRAARIALNLTNQPRMLLITLLFGNMLVNVLYFVISSVLLLHIDIALTGPTLPIALGLTSLIAIILAAEVVPKLLATHHALRWILVTSVPLQILHEILHPLRSVLATILIEPMLRLLGSHDANTANINFHELTDFLQLAHNQGTISAAEERFLRDVVELRRLKVRDAMTPRVRVAALPIDDLTTKLITETTHKKRRRYLPLYTESLDHITGIIDVQKLLSTKASSLSDATAIPTYIPELATLDHLLEHFRNTKTKCVVAVDEFGQTAGLVTLNDVVEEIIGLDPNQDDQANPAIIILKLGRWQLAPDLSVYDFAEAFNIQIGEPTVSTIAGLIVDELERIAEVGDSITLEQWRLTVTKTDGPRITEIQVVETK